MTVIEDLRELGLLVREAEVTLVEDERSSEGIHDAEERGDARSTAREDRAVAEQADGEKEPALACAVVATDPEVWDLSKIVVSPREEHVTAGELLEALRQVDVVVNECPDAGNELLFGAVLCR